MTSKQAISKPSVACMKKRVHRNPKPSAANSCPGESTPSVVAAVLTHKGRVCLLRRSSFVTGDTGLWHCVTGFLPLDTNPEHQATTEIAEEAGISPRDLVLKASAVLDIPGHDGRTWKVHAHHFASRTTAITLNWENDASSWLEVGQFESVATVSWLKHIIEALADSMGKDGVAP